MLTSWPKVKHLVHRGVLEYRLLTIVYFLAWWLELLVQASDEFTHGEYVE